MQPKTTAKDFFLYLAGFVTLYASAISLISLLFTIVNKAFPDSVSGNYYYGGIDPYSSGMRMAIAALIIIFPVYLVIATYLNGYLRANPDKKDMPVRKWLTFLTLFITAASVVTDLIVLVNTFLGGEITTRFILKVLAVLIVSGGVFAYYLYDLKKDFTPGMPNRSKLLVILSSIVVLATLIGGFALLGSPAKARALRFDQIRMQNLSMIQSQIVYDYWQRKGELPATLEDINDEISGFFAPVDPKTKEDYRYEKTGRITFKLCADFELPSDEIGQGDIKRPTMAIFPDNENWKHDAGETCFDRTVDEERYPIYEKTRLKI